MYVFSPFDRLVPRGPFSKEREAANAALTLGIKEIAQCGTAASRDWPWAGRVARIEALYQGLQELSQGRMHAAGAHFHAMVDDANANGQGEEAAVEAAPLALARPTIGKCGWLLKLPRGYCKDGAKRSDWKKTRRDRAIALYQF